MSARTEVRQELFSVEQTAKRVGRSASSTWRDIKAGRYKVVYINGSTRITGESIDAVIAGEAPRPAEIRIRRSRPGSSQSRHDRGRSAAAIRSLARRWLCRRQDRQTGAVPLRLRRA
jgi:hypothetical protein